VREVKMAAAIKLSFMEFFMERPICTDRKKMMATLFILTLLAALKENM
jgi:hypothetical protein